MRGHRPRRALHPHLCGMVRFMPQRDSCGARPCVVSQARGRFSHALHAARSSSGDGVGTDTVALAAVRAPCVWRGLRYPPSAIRNAPKLMRPDQRVTLAFSGQSAVIEEGQRRVTADAG